MHSKQGDKTAVIEARVDIRVLANLYDYFVANDARPNSKNEIVKLGLELAEAFLEKLGKVQGYERRTFTDAYNTLKHYGSLHRGQQNAKRMHQLVAEESLIAEVLERKGMGERIGETPFVDARLVPMKELEDENFLPEVADLFKGQELPENTHPALVQLREEANTISDEEWDNLLSEEKLAIRKNSPGRVPKSAR